MHFSMAYPTDLTDEQWVVIEPIVTYQSEDDRYKGGRPRTVNLRRIVDALLYQARTGVQWRLFPTDFPPSGTVRYYFDTWTWEAPGARSIRSSAKSYGWRMAAPPIQRRGVSTAKP